MGAEEDVAGQGFEHAEGLLVVFGDLRILLVVDELVSGVHVRTAYDDGVVGLAAFDYLHSPGGASFGVARCEMRDEHCAS